MFRSPAFSQDHTTGPGRLRLHLVPIKEDQDTTDPTLPAIRTVPSRFQSIQDRFMANGWTSLTPDERISLIEMTYQIWQQFSDYQRNCLVVEALGGICAGGAVPLWSTSPQMMFMLYERVSESLFQQGDFCDALYLLLARRQGFGFEDTGLPLIDPHQRALHLFTLMRANTPSIMSFTFVLIYLPQTFFRVQVPKQPNLVSGPILTVMTEA